MPFALRLRIRHLFCYPAPPPTVFHTLSLHDALPISSSAKRPSPPPPPEWEHSTSHSRALRAASPRPRPPILSADRKSTRLNSSHRCISYAVFCLKKKMAIFLISALRIALWV